MLIVGTELRDHHFDYSSAQCSSGSAEHEKREDKIKITNFYLQEQIRPLNYIQKVHIF